jgi:hypothetical protein
LIRKGKYTLRAPLGVWALRVVLCKKIYIHKWFLYASRVDKVKVELTDEGESYAWFNLDSLPENLTVITEAFLNNVDVLAKLKEI